METSNKTYFELAKRPFQDVPVTDQGVDTAAFLEACEDVVKMFDLFGSPAFAIVQNDMNGNIKKIRDRFLSHPDKSMTLEELVINEKGEKKRTATEGLMWLLRGLDFTCRALTMNTQNPTEELSVSFTKAYEQTLKKFHSFVVKPLFGLAMKACPYRATFYPKLGNPPEKVDAELKIWLEALASIVTRLQTFYVTGGHDKGF